MDGRGGKREKTKEVRRKGKDKQWKKKRTKSECVTKGQEKKREEEKWAVRAIVTQPNIQVNNICNII